MYKIVGGDQREYGPVTSDQIREWIASGRANGQTLASFEGSPWKPLSTYPEFADGLRTASPPPLANAPGVYPPAAGQAYTGTKTNNMAVAGLVFAVTFTFFALGWIGGGDAKLAAVTAPERFDAAIGGNGRRGRFALEAAHIHLVSSRL